MTEKVCSDLLALGEDLALQHTLEDQIALVKSFANQHLQSDFFLFLLRYPQHLNLNLPDSPAPYISIIDHIKTNPETLQWYDPQTGSHFLGIPLFQKQILVGVLIFSRCTKAYTREDIASLEALARLVSIAYQAVIFRQLHEFQEKQLKLVQNVTTQLVNITDLDELARTITELILNTFNYYYVAVFTHEPTSDFLIFRASARSEGASQPLFEYNPGARIKVGEHIVGHVAMTGEKLLANDVSREPRYGHLDTLSRTQSEVALPLIINGQVVGVLDVQSENINSFTESDLQLLEALADNIAIAVHRVRLYDTVHQRNEQLDAIEEVSQAITYILDLDELLEKVVTLIHEKFGYEYVHVFLTQPVDNHISFRSGSGKRAQAFKRAQVSYDLNAEKGIIVSVVRTGKLKCVNDVSQDQDFIPNPITKDFLGSELAIPLTFGKQILGVLDVQTDQINAFNEQDQELLSTLSASIAIAVRNAGLYHSETWRRQVAEALRDVVISLTDKTSPEKVFDTILVELSKILPFEVAGFWLMDTDNEDLSNQVNQSFQLKAFRTADPNSQKALQGVNNSQGSWIEQAKDVEVPLIRKSSDQADPIAIALNFPEDYSAIAAPLQIEGRILGLLTLHHHEEGRYGHESQSITASFAGYAAISIENTRLFESSQEQAWISTVLLQVAQATQSLSTIPELVSTVVRLTPLLVGVEGCALLLRESDSPIFLLHAFYGSVFKEDPIKLPMALPNASIFEVLFHNHAPVIITDPTTEMGLPQDMINDLSHKTLILLPLITHNELLGAFLLVQPAPHNNDSNEVVLSDERLAIIQGITQQTAIAVENIRLFEAKQEEAYVSAALLQVAQATVSSDNLDDTLESIVHIMPILVGIDCSVIYLWDPSSEKFFPSHLHCPDQYGSISELLELSYREGDFPLLDAVKSANKPVVHPMINPLPPEDWDLAIPNENILDILPILNSPFGLLMGFPLSVKGEVYGVLITQEVKFNPSRERRFELLNGIAQQVSLAIQNDHLNLERADRERMDREFQLAREIQQTFLPETLPKINGYETDVRWHTARQVGGDFYDFFKLSDDQYGIVIADVSDKGLAASLYMTVARTLLRAAALETTSTAKTLEKVNDLLLLDSQTGLFVTIFYAILDATSGNIRYTNAGHNLPYLIQASDGKLIELKGGGIAIGAMPSIHLPELEISLKAGDCLILHTDGVTETFDPDGNMYGNARYRKVLRRGKQLSSSQLLDLVENDLSDFRRNLPLGDDLTLLAIKRDPTHR
jgi:GAF domain-containing protein